MIGRKLPQAFPGFLAFPQAIIRSHGSHKEVQETNDATSTFLESVSSTIKGITHINYVEEFDKNITEAQKAGKKRFLIYRSDPSVCPI